MIGSGERGAAGLFALAAAGCIAAPPLAPWIAAAVCVDVLGARARPPTRPVDAIVVAGCKVGADGTPSAALARRCALAARLHAEVRARRVVVTGGAIGGRPAEADVAAELLARTAPQATIVIERRSRNTEENAAFAAALVGRDADVLVVTDSYHVLRCARIFARHFRSAAAVGAVGPARARLRGAAREVAALAVDALRGGARPKMPRHDPA